MTERLNKVRKLHLETKNEIQKESNTGLAKRLLVDRISIARIGKHYDDRNREDLSIESVLISYLARKVYINEMYLRGRFYSDELYQKEVLFTNGLWEIFCMDYFGEYIPQLPVPETYDELQNIFDNKEEHINFNIYQSVREAITYNKLVDSNICIRHKEFNKMCYLKHNYAITLYKCLIQNPKTKKRRAEPAIKLFKISVGFYKYEYLKAAEPYQHFWKERAYLTLLKAIALFERNYISRFRYAVMNEMPELPPKWIPIDGFEWNIKRK